MSIIALADWQAGVISLVCFVLGIGLAALVAQLLTKTKAKTFKEDLHRQLDGAKKEAENIIKSARVDAAEETIKKKEKFSAEADKIRAELRETEMRLAKREDLLERETESLLKQDKNLKERDKDLQRRLRNLDLKEKELTSVITQQKNQLLKITAMNVEEARQLLLTNLEEECEHEMATIIRLKQEQASEIADEKSREIITKG